MGYNFFILLKILCPLTKIFPFLWPHLLVSIIVLISSTLISQISIFDYWTYVFNNSIFFLLHLQASKYWMMFFFVKNSFDLGKSFISFVNEQVGCFLLVICLVENGYLLVFSQLSRYVNIKSILKEIKYCLTNKISLLYKWVLIVVYTKYYSPNAISWWLVSQSTKKQLLHLKNSCPIWLPQAEEQI